jgi:hypothetical protein
VSPGFTLYWMRTRPLLRSAISEAGKGAGRRGGGTDARGIGMISSVPRASRLLWLASIAFAEAMSETFVPYWRATEARVCPRAMVCVRKVTRLSAGSLSRQTRTLEPRPWGTLTSKVRLAGVASRRSSGFSICM